MAALESLPGVRKADDLFDVIAALQQKWIDSSISTEVLIGERHANDEGAGNRVVFVPMTEVSTAASAPIQLGQVGRATLDFGCDVFVWGTDDDDETVKHRAALAILYNVIVTLPDVSGDRVFLVSTTRDLVPTQADYGHQYHLAFFLRYQVNASTLLQVPPKPYAANVSTVIEDP